MNTPTTDATQDEPRPRYDWTDPLVPLGNGPVMPRWPLMAGGVAWAVWILFLATMAIAG